jgi:serine acetyltransferase
MESDIESKGEISIEDDVWIGSGAIVLSGVTIGRGSVVGAGSVVTKSIPPYSVAVGNPARVVKRRFRDKTIENLERLRWWEWNVETLKKHQHLFNLNEEELLAFFSKDAGNG